MSFLNQTYAFPDGLLVTIRVEAPRPLTADEIRWVASPIAWQAESVLQRAEIYGYQDVPS